MPTASRARRKRGRSMDTYCIGIAGGTASGKTSIVKLLENELCDRGQVIYMDAYYRAFSELSLAERKKMNFDHPDSFDADGLVRDVLALKSGQAIRMPVYDYVDFTRAETTILVEPHPVIIVEGLLVFWYPELRNLLDLKIFVDTPDDERLIRRIRRDISERGRSLESILTQYQQTVRPMHEQFIGPSKAFADIILPRGAENTNGVRLVREHIRGVLRKEGL